MNQPSYPVTVAVQRNDGTVEQVRVGTATRVGEGFQLTLGNLAIGAVADSASAAPSAAAYSSAPRRAAGAPAPSSDGMVFPPYGRSKGAPIAGASRQDLEFYANGCRRTLADQGKARWHDKERALLAVIEAEMNRGDGGPDESAYAPRSSAPIDDDRGPPRTDDEIPF